MARKFLNRNKSIVRANREATGSSKILVRNRDLSYVIAAAHNVGFLTPIWVIFGTDHLGLSLFLSLVLGSTGWVSSAIFEVPMGAFADRFGRKLSLILGLILNIIGDLSLVLTDNFLILICFQVVAGFGYAMTSGSLEGLLHDTYETEGEITAYSKLSSQLLSILNISRILTVPIGTWLYTSNIEASLSSYTYPYIASASSYSIALVCVFFLTEERSSKREISNVRSSAPISIFSNLFSDVGATWQEMIRNRDVKRVITALGLYSFLGEGNWALYQSYFRGRDISIANSGWIYTVLLVFVALGARYAAKVYKKVNVMWAMNFVIGFMTINIVLMHLPITFAIPAFIFTAFLSTFSWYFQDNAIQNRISGDHKTTALSIASMLYNFGAMAGVFGIGAVADRIGVLNAQWIFVVYGTIVFACMGIWSFSDGPKVRIEDARATGVDIPFDDTPQLKP